jgi:hypothetical protein
MKAKTFAGKTALKVIKMARHDWAAGKNISGPFKTGEEIQKHLEKLMKKVIKG